MATYPRQTGRKGRSIPNSGHRVGLNRRGGKRRPPRPESEELRRPISCRPSLRPRRPRYRGSGRYFRFWSARVGAAPRGDSRFPNRSALACRPSSSRFAVDGEIEEGKIAFLALDLRLGPDRPNVSLPPWRLDADALPLFQGMRTDWS